MEKGNKVSATLTVRLSEQVAEAMAILIENGVHRSRGEIVRVALDAYIAFFVADDGKSLLSGVDKFRRLIADRRRNESVASWVREVQPMLERALLYSDKDLIIDVINTAAEAFTLLPLSYQYNAKAVFDSEVSWKIAAELAGNPEFWNKKKDS